jgi:hypothetical protein
VLWVLTPLWQLATARLLLHLLHLHRLPHFVHLHTGLQLSSALQYACSPR